MMKLLAVLSVLMVVAGSISAGPNLHIQNSDFDFGMVGTGMTVYHRTWLKATSDSAVTINAVKTGCFCLVAPLPDSTIPAGDSIPLDLTWRVQPAEETVSRTVLVFPNTDSEPLRISLTAQPIVHTDTLPFEVPWQGLRFGGQDEEQIDRAFMMANLSDSSMTVTVISAPDERYQLELPESVPAQNHENCRITLKTDQFDGPYEGSFTVELTGDWPVPRRLTIPIVVGDFSYRAPVTTLQ
ncbi:MAG: DUF1573 domain-containing protein [candidate division Zixibacteria bacterium]|nr:DUF1573 domain-containing protein [candidate division Zixibacteria bacterium]